MKRGMLTAAVLAAAFLAAAAVPRPEAPLKGAAFIIIRGGDLEKPVLLHHVNVRVREREDGSTVAIVEDDPLFRLYGSLRSTHIDSVDELPDGVVTYEVAEFLGPEWAALADRETGRPTVELDFDAAPFHSTMYRSPAGGAVVWQHPMGSDEWRNITEDGRRALAAYGLEWL